MSDGGGSNMMSQSSSAPASGDEDEAAAGPLGDGPDLEWEDDGLRAQLLASLNQMRKDKHFCDVILQIGKRDLYAHRAVLASASPYLMDVFSDEKEAPSMKEAAPTSTGIVYHLDDAVFQKDALEALIEYAYTARLRVPASQVKSVYMAAVHLRMDRAARQCADFLSAHLDLRSCLEVRALPGVSRRLDVVRSVDAFIRRNMDELLRTLPQNGVLTALDKVKVEVLHASREELEAARARSVAQLVLDWIRAQWMGDERLTLDMLRDKAHMLFLGKDNTLEDCEEIAEGSENDSELVQDYRKNNQQQHPKQQQNTKKVRRVSNHMRPARPRELLYTRQIDHCEDHSPTNMTSGENNEEDEEWKVISCSALEGGSSILALITIDGHLCTCSIMQKVNSSNGRSVSPTVFSAAASDSNPDSNSGSKSPSLSSRPPSQDKDMFSLITPMVQAKCGAGAVSMDGKLIVCGGFDRGECLRQVSAFDPSTNSWESMPDMQVKRGRFDAATSSKDGQTRIYAVAGSLGQMETNTAERYDPDSGKWTHIASLPAAISSNGVCSLDGVVYSIGGTYGQSGNKHCYKLVDNDTKWERIANLIVGRSQAAVTAFQGKIYAVGGCDAWNPLSSVEIYDPQTNTWKMGPPMLSARRGCGLAVRADGTLLAVGGSDGTQALCTTEVLDPRMGLWAAAANMTSCRVNVTCATTQDGKIWAVGGFSGKSFLNTLECLDPDRDEWTTYIREELDNDDSTDEEDEESQKVQHNQNNPCGD